LQKSLNSAVIKDNRKFWFTTILCLILICKSNLKAFSNIDTNKVFVKEVIISGLHLTRKLVILRELTVVPNQLVSKQVLESNFEHDKGQLSHLMLFKNISGTINYTCADTAIVTYFLKESVRYGFAPVLQLSDRNFNTWYKLYNADVNRLNIGGTIRIKNISGLNKIVTLEFQTGFNDLYGIAYDIPRFKKHKNWGIGAKYFYRNMKTYPINILNNKQVFYRSDTSKVYNENNFLAYASYKRNIYETHKFSVGITSMQISNELWNQNQNLFGENQKEIDFLVAKYKYAFVYTNNPVYATRGSKVEAELKYNGQPLAKNSNVNMQTALELLYANFQSLGKNFYTAIHVRLHISKNNNAFLNTKALGYSSNTVRAYEYYIIHGNYFRIGRMDFKYKLLDRILCFPSKKIKGTLPFAIYPKIFLDGGYVATNDLLNNSLANTLLKSAGVGLDFHINNNQLMRIEYGINHLKQKGLFLNFISL
jgi:outer membrane protein assembly factor BamA